MTMRVVPPIAIWEGLFTTNVLEDEHDEWSGEEIYAKGARVQWGHWIFESAQDGNEDHEPGPGAVDTEWWLVDMATNPYRVWEPFRSAYTSRAGFIDMTVTPGDVVKDISLYGLQGETAQVIGTHPVDGEFYNKTLALDAGYGEGNWFDLFYEYPRFRKKAPFLDIPPYADASYRIIVDNGSGEARIGNAVLGYGTDLGLTQFGYSASSLSFSTKKRNAFGRPTYQRGVSYQTLSVDVELPTPAFEGIREFLVEQDATAAAYIGSSSRDELNVFAVYDDFRIVGGNPAKSGCALELQEVILT